MRDGLVKILFIIILIVFIAILFRPTEGFDDTVMNKVQDRANPLASGQHPLTNPSADIGIPQSSGSSLRTMSQAALNIPMQIPVERGIFRTSSQINTLSPRIDNESSFLGLVKFCKETGASLADPFTDSNFLQNCGMCMSSGTLITGEKFTEPTGVVVYQEDKKTVYGTKDKNKYRFPRAIPSLKSATCDGASLFDDSIVPVLAIDQNMFKVITNRNYCRTHQTFGNSCGQCTSDTSSWSYVQNPPDGGIYETSLYLYGKGLVQVSVGGKPVGSAQSLSPTALIIDLGVVTEGTNIQVKVTTDKDGSSPYLYSALKNTLPNGSDFFLPFDDIVNKDEITGSYPRRMSPKFFTDMSLALSQLLPSPGQPTGKVQMILDATMPLTFVGQDQIAAYDCETGPYTMTQEDAENYISGMDPCLNPPGQGPNNYSEECIQSKLFAAGCSTGGDWYLNGLPGTATFGNTIGDINTWLQDQVANNSTDPNVAKGCYGQDLSTPCDQYIGNSEIPDQQCLAYLYSNTSAQNRRLGLGYPSGGDKYLSLEKNTDQFCQPAGLLNPGTKIGLAELQNVAGGYSGYKGVDAVKAYLSDVFTKAVGNLDINIEDSAGGRKTSWMKCFGIPIDDVPEEILYEKTTITRPVLINGPIHGVPDPIVDPGQIPQPPITYKPPPTNNPPVVDPGIKPPPPGDKPPPHTNNPPPIVNPVIKPPPPADKPPVPPSNPCTTATGSPVYPSIQVGTPGNSPWHGGGGWEINAPPVGNGVMWIWNTPNGNKGIPTTGNYYKFSYVFCNTQNITKVFIACGIDNNGSVTLNGTQIMSGAGGLGQKAATLVPGSNTIVIEAANAGGPGGVWLAIMKQVIQTPANPFDPANPNNVIHRYSFYGGANSAYVKQQSKNWVLQHPPVAVPGPVICKTDSSWVWTPSSRSATTLESSSGSQGCFTGETLITMADGSKKRIDSIVCDELVLSGNSGQPVKVIAIDSVEGHFSLFGINGQSPFSTKSHCFLSDSGKRITLNVEEAIEHKRWERSEMLALVEGSSLKTYDEVEKKITTTLVTSIDSSGSVLKVYNLTTSDHTFIVNGFSVSDDFPEIEKHPKLSLRILLLLQQVKDEELNLSYGEIFSKYSDACILADIDVNTVEQKMPEFLELCKRDSRYIRLGDKLWTHKFNELSI